MRRSGLPFGKCQTIALALAISAPWASRSTSAAPFTGDLLVQSQEPGYTLYDITEYRLGQPVTTIQSFPVQSPPGTYPSSNPRDIVVGDDGRLYAFTAWPSEDNYLSIYDPVLSQWSYLTRPGWRIASDASYGGIAYWHGKVFATNMASTGVVVFDTVLGTSAEIAPGIASTDLTLGLDGKLWVLQSPFAYAFDPTTFAPLGSVNLGQVSSLRSIAVAANGDFYTATWDGRVVHLGPTGGVLGTLTVSNSLKDIDIAPDGRIAIGSRLDGAWLTDTGFSAPVRVGGTPWNSFVTFIPEPAPLPGFVAAFLLALRHARRG